MENSQEIKNWNVEGSNFSPEFTKKFGDLMQSLSVAVHAMQESEMREFIRVIALLGASKRAQVKELSEMAAETWQ